MTTRTAIAEPSAWLGADIQNSDRWIHRLDPNEIAGIDAALAHFRATGKPLAAMARDDFPLPAFADAIGGMLTALEDGLGLYLLRGFPAMDYGVEELRAIYWGIGLYCGAAVSQSKRGDVLGDVRDLGTPHDGPEFRGYTSNGELTYHSDAADVTGLFCLRAAKRGGLSRIVSLAAIHNEILRRDPDLLEVLYGAYPWGLQGNEKPGEPSWYWQPVFAVDQGRFAGRYTRTHIRTAEMNPDAPDLSSMQKAALDLIDSIAAEDRFNVTMMFEPGDIQFLNNHLTLHTRTAFEDHDDPALKRHLLRLWLAPTNSRALPAGFAPFYRDIRPGVPRGGFPGHTDERRFATA
jgi:hypothetical protein